MPGYIYWKDRESHYIGCNDNLVRASGLSHRSELLGKTDHDFFWGKDNAEQFILDDQKVMRDRVIHTTEYVLPIIRDDGRNLMVRTDKMPLIDKHNEVIGVLAIAIDITDQKILEEKLIQEKNRSETANLVKAEFIASMSHEFRTPLNAIMGITQLLLISPTKEDLNAKLKAVMSAGKHLLSLISDILDFGKLESAKFQLDEKSFSFTASLTNTINQLNFLLENNNDLKLEFFFSEKLPEFIVADEKCLNQIMFNLVGNAVKFTESGTICVNVTLVNKSCEYVDIFLEVIDTGIGISKDKLSQIFERFTQVDSSYNRKYGGIGLGLAITQKIVMQMGGEIGVDSEEGVGSRFWSRFKFLLTELKQSPDERNVDNWLLANVKDKIYDLTFSENVTVKPLSNKHVVVIEDDPNRLNQLVIKSMLESLGSTASLFSTAHSALSYLEANSLVVDLILTDIGLPDMNSMELIKQIRSDSRYSACPIVAVTGFCSVAEIKSFLEAGADEVITKPICFAKFKACVQHYLEKAHA